MSALRDTATRGLAAGFAGTVALTASQRIEMAITGRPPSDLPAMVASGILGISPRGRTRSLVAFTAHWVNNTSSGLGRAALGAAGLSGVPAAAGTFGLYMVGSSLMFHTLGVVPLPWRRRAPELAIDLLHAGVYGVATNAAYEALERRGAP
jgi:hypothetical protein